jgi:hypothetical protein
MKDKKIRRGERYYDLNGVIHVVIYSKTEMIKLMPLKNNSMISVWETEEFKEQIKLLKFVEIPHPPITRINVSEHLLEFQFNIIGKTMSDTTIESDWQKEWKLNTNQRHSFRSYASGILKKVFKFNTSKTKETLKFFELNFGLPEDAS